jgi:nicotinamidase-related amidase
MSNTGILNRNHAALLVIDIQERLMPVIQQRERTIRNTNTLLKGAEIFSLKIFITEQYPKGLGKTCTEILLPQTHTLYEKICFSCMQSAPILNDLKANGIKDLIICGVEAHICVLKTVLEGIELGFNVHVVADAISSRSIENKQLAIDRMRQSGAFIVSTEMILFMLLNEAGTAEFKAISQLIK